MPEPNPVVPIGKFIFWKVIGACFVAVGLGLVGIGISGFSDPSVAAPIKAITIGLGLSAFGGIILVIKRNRKFIWQR